MDMHLLILINNTKLIKKSLTIYSNMKLSLIAVNVFLHCRLSITSGKKERNLLFVEILPRLKEIMHETVQYLSKFYST